MTKKRIKGGARLRDVAAAAGVSNATVSAVVNGRAGKYGICKATQAKVEAIVRQMGYTPSLAALDMVAGRNMLVGLVLQAGQPGADRLIASLESRLAASGYHLIVTHISDPATASARIAELIRFGLAGIIIWSREGIPLPALTCPAVLIGHTGAGSSSVAEDATAGGRLLARRLLDKGHRSLALVGESPASAPVVAGFLEACAQSGATVRSFTSVAAFMANPVTATALCCVTSPVLMEFYSRAMATTLRPGANLALVAVDDLAIAGNLVPRPTALQPVFSTLGEAAAQQLLQVISGTAAGNVRLAPAISDGDTLRGADVPIRPNPRQETVAEPVPVKPPVAPPAPAPNPVPKPAISPSETFQIAGTGISGTTVAGLSNPRDEVPDEPIPAVVQPVSPVIPVAEEPTPVIETVPVEPVVEPTQTDPVESEPDLPAEEPVPVAAVQQEPEAAPSVAEPEPIPAADVAQGGAPESQEPVSQPPENPPAERQPEPAKTSSETFQMPETPASEPVSQESAAREIPVNSEPTVVPEPVVTPEPVAVPEPAVIPEPAPVPEPVVEAPKPVPEAPPVVVVQPVSPPEPVPVVVVEPVLPPVVVVPVPPVVPPVIAQPLAEEPVPEATSGQDTESTGTPDQTPEDTEPETTNG